MYLNRLIIDNLIFRLFKGTAKYDRSESYSELVLNWKDERPCPSEQILNSEYLYFYKDLIIEKINPITDKKILHGFSYQGKEFYLSIENQFNYKSAYDARASLVYPYKIKAKTEYVELADASELSAYYLAAFLFVQQCIKNGWEAKEQIANADSILAIDEIYNTYKMGV